MHAVPAEPAQLPSAHPYPGPTLWPFQPAHLPLHAARAAPLCALQDKQSCQSHLVKQFSSGGLVLSCEPIGCSRGLLEILNPSKHCVWKSQHKKQLSGRAWAKGHMCPEQYCRGAEQVEHAGSNHQGFVPAFYKHNDCSAKLTLLGLCALCLQCALSLLQLSPLQIELSGLCHQPFVFCCSCSGLVCLTLTQSMFSFLQGLLLLFIFCSTTEGVLSVAIYCKMVQSMCNILCILRITTGMAWPC